MLQAMHPEFILNCIHCTIFKPGQLHHEVLHWCSKSVNLTIPSSYTHFTASYPHRTLTDKSGCSHKQWRLQKKEQFSAVGAKTGPQAGAACFSLIRTSLTAKLHHVNRGASFNRGRPTAPMTEPRTLCVVSASPSPPLCQWWE